VDVLSLLDTAKSGTVLPMKNAGIKILLLGSGELGKEFTIAAQRLGLFVIAVDRYPGAPAMQVADAWEVIDMLKADQLESIVTKHQPQIIVPEIEAIRTEKLKDFEPVAFKSYRRRERLT
jgi:formate-dependent phosphoribosylglycinamide formyltransferase (GAR transformylase)